MGRTPRDPGRDRHHCFYERSIYQHYYPFNLMRQLSGLVIPLDIEAHGNLHAELRHGVPMPSLESTRTFLRVVKPFEEGQALTRTLDQAIGWFATVGEMSTAEHLACQREIILKAEEEENERRS